MRRTKYHLKLLILMAGLIIGVLKAPAQFIYRSYQGIPSDRQWPDKHEKIQLTDSIPYSNIRIIDSRYDTTGLGFFRVGFLVLKDSCMSVGLKHVMNVFFGPLCLEGRDTLLIQIEKLKIQDALIKDIDFIYAAGNIKASLFKGGNNSYKYIGAVDTVMLEKFDRKKTRKAHMNDKNINSEFWDFYLLRLFEAAIRQASLSDSVQTELNQIYTMEEIRQSGLVKRDKPILKADSLHPGFYRNFSEFVNNNPTFLYVNSEALHNLLQVMNYKVGNNIIKDAPDTSYWGFCTGRKIFVRYQYNFFQLERKDGNFYISPTSDGIRIEMARNASNFLSDLMAVTIGVATNSSIDFDSFGSIPKMEIPMVVLSGIDYKILGLQVDWDTGGIIF